MKLVGKERKPTCAHVRVPIENAGCGARCKRGEERRRLRRSEEYEELPSPEEVQRGRDGEVNEELVRARCAACTRQTERQRESRGTPAEDSAYSLLSQSEHTHTHVEERASGSVCRSASTLGKGLGGRRRSRRGSGRGESGKPHADDACTTASSKRRAMGTRRNKALQEQARYGAARRPVRAGGGGYDGVGVGCTGHDDSNTRKSDRGKTTKGEGGRKERGRRWTTLTAVNE